VDAAEEMRRVLPVIQALADQDVVVSVDTMRCETAKAALDAGARIVNDVSGGLSDPDLPRLVAEAGVPYIAMHWRGHSDEMQQHARYDDVVADVSAELRGRLDALTAVGVDLDQIVLDPGLGFAKTAENNWTLLAHLDQLIGLGQPLLVGASRKTFLGALLAADQTPRDSDHREDATVAVTALAAAAGAWAVRVHSARPNADAVRVVAAVASARRSQ
jgi:dihydropteroate synthase